MPRVAARPGADGPDPSGILHPSVYEVIVHHGADAVVLTDAQGVIRYANPAAQAALGHPDGSWAGRNVFALVHPDDLAEALEGMGRILHVPGPNARHRCRLVTAGGAVLWAEVQATDLRHVPEVGGLLFTVRDVSDRVAAEQALERSERRYRELLEQSPDAVFINVAGVVRFANAAGAELYGVADALELVGRSLAELVPAEDAAEVLRRTHDTGNPLGTQTRAEERILRADGSVRPVEVSRATVTFDGEAAALVVLRDIAQRKVAEWALRESEERFRTLYEHAPIGMVLTEASSGAVIQANQAMLDMLGYGAEHFLGRSHWDLTPPEFHHLERVQADERARAGRSRPVEMEHLHASGRRVPIVATSVLVADALGRPMVWRFVEDVTALRQREADLREAVAAAEAANRAKSQFLSRMSHELRTPMNAVLGFAQLMQLSELTPALEESVEQILRAGRHLMVLIDEVLDISRIEQDRMEVAVTPVELGPLLDGALELVRAMAMQRQVQLIPPPPPAGVVVVCADQARLHQVLVNLLSNAVKYNRQGGSVCVGAGRTPSGSVRIEVRDTGRGLTADQVGRLFQPFERLDAADLGVEGTGIGLALAKRLVELMGGSIHVESEPGVGSTFAVELPPG